MRNLSPKVKTATALVPQTVAATATSGMVDTADFGSNGFLVHIGAGAMDASNKITPTIYESDDDSTYTAAADADHYTAPTAQAASSLRHVEYRGAKRYIKMKLVVAGTVSNPCSVASIQGHPELQPPL